VTVGKVADGPFSVLANPNVAARTLSIETKRALYRELAESGPEVLGQTLGRSLLNPERDIRVRSIRRFAQTQFRFHYAFAFADH
jgi:hypothetical protein